MCHTLYTILTIEKLNDSDVKYLPCINNTFYIHFEEMKQDILANVPTNKPLYGKSVLSYTDICKNELMRIVCGEGVLQSEGIYRTVTSTIYRINEGIIICHEKVCSQ